MLLCLEAEPEESAGTHGGPSVGIPEKQGEEGVCLFPLMLKNQVRHTHPPHHTSMEGRKEGRILGTCRA